MSVYPEEITSDEDIVRREAEYNLWISAISLLMFLIRKHRFGPDAIRTCAWIYQKKTLDMLAAY